MTVSLIVPGVITEVISTGNLTVIPAALNVIGIVGTFERGEVAKITTVGSIDEAISKLGNWNDALTGMKAVYLALSQNQTPTKCVRVAGSTVAAAELAVDDTVVTALAVAAAATDTSIFVDSVVGLNVGQTLRLGTTAGSRENVIIAAIDADAGEITLEQALVGVSYAVGQLVTVCNVATTFAGNEAIGQTVLSVTATTGFVAGQTVLLGLGDGGADYEEKIIASVQPGVSITLTVAVVNAYVTGESITAVVAVDDVATFTVKQPGAFGNQYTLTVEAGSITGTAKLIFSGDGVTEIYDSIATTAALVSWINGTTAGLPSSKLVTAEAGSSTFLPAPMAATNFSGGDNGALTDDGTPSMSGPDRLLYLGSASTPKTGVHVFDSEEVDLIVLAGQSSPSSATALDTYVQSRGDCIAIYGGYLGETVDDLVIRASKGGEVSTFPSVPVAALNSDRAVVTGPGVLFQHPINGTTVTLWGAYMAAAYAGRLSALDPFRSPSHKNINGILGLEDIYSETEVTTLTLGRVSPVTKFQSMGFLIRNGLTTSADPTFSQASNRRLTDQIIRGLTEIFTPLVSEPNNSDLAQQLATGADAFLGRLAEAGSQGGAALEAYSIKVHASSLDKLARQVFVDISFLQNGPADYIRLRLKPSDASLSVQTNP